MSIILQLGRLKCLRLAFRLELHRRKNRPVEGCKYTTRCKVISLLNKTRSKGRVVHSLSITHRPWVSVSLGREGELCAAAI